ncbi:MAG: hypothetical protein N3E51_00640 [Candidatus Micrarchaeota archaeon]|nr:hypothetical protein [Candidatus Micrarchaeota archaeon]
MKGGQVKKKIAGLILAGTVAYFGLKAPGSGAELQAERHFAFSREFGRAALKDTTFEQRLRIIDSLLGRAKENIEDSQKKSGISDSVKRSGEVPPQKDTLQSIPPVVKKKEAEQGEREAEKKVREEAEKKKAEEERQRLEAEKRAQEERLQKQKAEKERQLLLEKEAKDKLQKEKNSVVAAYQKLSEIEPEDLKYASKEEATRIKDSVAFVRKKTRELGLEEEVDLETLDELEKTAEARLKKIADLERKLEEERKRTEGLETLETIK